MENYGMFTSRGIDRTPEEQEIRDMYVALLKKFHIKQTVENG